MDSNLPVLSSKEAMKLTIGTAGKGVQLSRLSLDRGESGAAMVVAKLLTETLSFLNCKLSDSDIVNYSFRIVSEFWNLKLEDLILILRKGTGGEYGKAYHTFTYSTLMEWIAAYGIELEDFLHNKHLNKKHGDCEPIEMNKQSVGAEKFTLLREKLEAATRVKNIEEQKKEPLKSNHLDAIIKKFDELHLEQYDIHKGARFVQVDGKMMNIQEFIEHELVKMADETTLT